MGALHIKLLGVARPLNGALPLGVKVDSWGFCNEEVSMFGEERYCCCTVWFGFSCKKYVCVVS